MYFLYVIHKNKIELFIWLKLLDIKISELIENIEPVPLRTTTELALCKPNNLPNVEKTRGQEHVIKVLKAVKYKSPKGEVISIQALIIILSLKCKSTLKVLDTKCNLKYVEKQTAYLGSRLPKGVADGPLEYRATDRISDSLKGIRDPLSLEIGNNLFTLDTCKWRTMHLSLKGDGVIVVPFFNILLIAKREGLQETIFNKGITSVAETIHYTLSVLTHSLAGYPAKRKSLRLNTFDYNSKYVKKFFYIPSVAYAHRLPLKPSLVTNGGLRSFIASRGVKGYRGQVIEREIVREWLNINRVFSTNRLTDISSTTSSPVTTNLTKINP